MVFKQNTGTLKDENVSLKKLIKILSIATGYGVYKVRNHSCKAILYFSPCFHKPKGIK